MVLRLRTLPVPYLALGLVLGAACTALVPAAARACQYVYELSFFDGDPPDSIELSREGVLVLGALESSFPGAVTPPITVAVRDVAGLLVSGSAERVQLNYSQFLWVWRADAPVDPDGVYTVSIGWSESLGARAVMLPARVAADFHSGPNIPAAPEIDARRENVPQQECEPRPGSFCDEEDCRLTHEVQAIWLRWAGDESLRDRYVTYRMVVATLDGPVVSPLGWTASPSDAAHVPSVGVQIPTRPGQHCLHLEATSVIDGSVVRSEEVCVDDVSVPDIEAPLMKEGGCGVAPVPAGSRGGHGAYLVAAGLLLLLAGRRRL